MGFKKTLVSIVLGGAMALGLGGKANADIIEGYTVSNPAGNSTQVSTYGISETQTFTIGTTGDNQDYVIDQVRLKLSSTADVNSSYVRLVRATDPLLGTDGNLFEPSSIGHFNGSNLGSESKWVDIPMSSYVLKASEIYRIILHAGQYGRTDAVNWECNPAAGYGGGDASFVSLSNSFPNFVPLNGDFMFEVHGTPVPEPATLGMLALGGLGLFANRRKK